MYRVALALTFVLVAAPAFAGTRYDKVTKTELGRMSGPEAGTSSKNLARFMRNRQPLVEPRMARYQSLARAILDGKPRALKPPTAAQADLLFTQLDRGRLGSAIADDFCFMRAEIAARSIERQGFEVGKVNAISTGGTQLTAKTPSTPGGTSSWRYHVAPLVTVGDEQYVLDPALGRGKMTLRGWKAKMHDRGMETIVTGSDQLSFTTRPATTKKARVQQLAQSLAQLGGIRDYEPFRQRALAKNQPRL